MRILLILLIFPLKLLASSGLCIHCLNQNNYWRAPQIATNPYFYGQSQYPMPWWYPYGQYQYTNWQSPGLWQPTPPSMIGHHYPGDGNMAAAKPNVYVSGPATTKFNINVNFKSSTLWIAAPTLNGEKSHWRGEILANGKLALEGVHYPYLYYDYRSHLELFQMEEGMCGSKNQIISHMSETLGEMGFRAQEIADFKEHWPHKLPTAAKYCVFPQEAEALQKAVEFEISPKAHLVQVNFIVYLDHEQAPAPKPLRPWRAKSSSKNDPATFEVREWGVSFVVDEKKVH